MDSVVVLRFFKQVYLLLWKIWKLKFRKPISTAFEIGFPIAIIGLIFYFRTLIEEEVIPADLRNEEFATVGCPLFFTPEMTLAVAPNDANTQAFLDYLNTTTAIGIPCAFPESIEVFNSEQDIEDVILETGYEDRDPQIFAAIVFESTSPSWEYKIRYGSQLIPDTSIFVDDFTTDLSSLAFFDQYVGIGGAGLQKTVDEYIYQTETGVIGIIPPGFSLNYNMQYTPNDSYIADPYFIILGSAFPLYILLSYLWPFTRMVKLILEEKTTRIKEGMKMMGLSDVPYFTAWIITYLIVFGISSFFNALILGPVFKNSLGIAVFLMFFVFCLSIMALAILLTTMFSKPGTAVNVSIFFFLGGYILFAFFQDVTVEAGRVDALCMYAPTCFAFAIRTASVWESAQVGVTGNTWYTLAYNTSFGRTLGFMTLDLFLYALLAWYLDKVIPTEYGTTLPWNFLFYKSYWLGKGEDDALLQEEVETLQKEKVGVMDNEYYEVEEKDEGREVGIEILKLRREFNSGDGTFTAVNDIFLNMYEGEVFALLGHNGAGKTTTISMLTGLIEVTSGDALIFGNSINTQMSEVHRMIGVCPQKNILFDDLTVKEHLVFALKFKKETADADEIEETVKSMVEEIGLVKQLNQLSGNLSGGEKRKLGVAMAFIGNPKVIFLDEPTSGMDVNSRRSTWEMIKKNKAGKVIVLTTHFMDEADLLGDRIAIMAHGKIVCMGSSLFLKSKYGVGYTFVISKKEGTSSKPILSLMKEHLGDFDVLNDVGTELFIRVSFKESKNFPKLFRELDANIEKLGIVTYGCSVTTLEEVFLKVGHNQEMKKNLSTFNSNGAEAKEIEMEEKKGADPEDGQSKIQALMKESGQVTELNPVVKFLVHLRALLVKRFHFSKRDPFTLTCLVLIPSLLVALGFWSVITGIADDFNDYTVSFDEYRLTNEETGEVYNSPVPFINANGSNLDFIDYFQSSSVDKFFLDAMYVGPADNSSDAFAESITAFRAEIGQEMLDRRFEYTNAPRGAVADVSELMGLDNTYWMYINHSALHGVPVFMNAVSNSALRKNIAADTDVSISTSVHPLPLSQFERELQERISAFFLSFNIAQAFMFIPGSLIYYVVFENQSKAKHQQLISGVSITAYWVSNFVWDFVMYMLPFWVVVILFLSFGFAPYVGVNFGATFLLLLLFGYSAIPFVYLMSYAFSNGSTARNVTILVFLITGPILYIVSFILSLIPSTMDVNSDLEPLFRLFPLFCLATGFKDLSFNFAEDPPLGEGVAGEEIVAMAWEGIVYFILVIIVEYIISVPRVALFFLKTFGLLGDIEENEEAQELLGKVDEDVAKEAERAMNADQCKGDLINVQGIRKVYGSDKIAVRDLSFSIGAGECFGFLGVNGAGKTTTLSILSGDKYPTRGSASLGGFDIINDQLQVRQLIGYCPQFDSLIGKLTAREHLTLYARIKGVSESNLAKIVDGMIEYLTLEEYANRPAGNYSGGNKRKLSVAISLIGDPKIVLLDEPSTGMDPVSRRFMWKFISETMANRSVILTTHSMEECEALCNRVGIMVAGRLKCLGTPNHLKNRFGQGFQLDMVTRIENADKLKEAIEKELFKDSSLIEQHGGSLKYRLPKSENRVLADIFEVMEKKKKELNIIEYSVGQTTLEQIFIRFAQEDLRRQAEEEEAKRLQELAK